MVQAVVSFDGSTWVEARKLTASDAAPDDRFGYSVAIDGDVIVIGAHGDDLPGKANAGSAYIYVFALGSWSQVA